MIECEVCEGHGYTAEHGCNDDVRICVYRCPVQVECSCCLGTGFVVPVGSESS